MGQGYHGSSPCTCDTQTLASAGILPLWISCAYKVKDRNSVHVPSSHIFHSCDASSYSFICHPIPEPPLPQSEPRLKSNNLSSPQQVVSHQPLLHPPPTTLDALLPPPSTTYSTPDISPTIPCASTHRTICSRMSKPASVCQRKTFSARLGRGEGEVEGVGGEEGGFGSGRGRYRVRGGGPGRRRGIGRGGGEGVGLSSSFGGGWLGWQDGDGVSDGTVGFRMGGWDTRIWEWVIDWVVEGLIWRVWGVRSWESRRG